MVAGPVAASAVRRRIALDGMGGDHAPRELVLGALAAAAELPVTVLLVGKEEVLRQELARSGQPSPANIEIVDAREVVEMNDTALTFIRKRHSSVRVAAMLVAEGRAEAFVSAGHTAAAWAIAKKVLGMIEGVERPALASILPSLGGNTLLLDVGANVDTKPHHLREFAVMGHFYSQMLFGIAEPRVGLLSIGEEEGKGNDFTREVFRVLKETGLNFIGNAEGRDIYNGNCDVVVCDGFVGNVVLKASEALAEFVRKTLRDEIEKSPIRKAGYLLTKPAFDELKRRTDYSEYGGAPLLGVKGGCIVCHGRSNAKAIRNAIRVAATFVENGIDSKIREKISDLHSREKTTTILVEDEDDDPENEPV